MADDSDEVALAGRSLCRRDGWHMSHTVARIGRAGDESCYVDLNSSWERGAR